MGTIAKVYFPAKYLTKCDRSAPRISEEFASNFLDDLNSLEPNDYITLRQLFRACTDEELQEIKDSINFFKRQLSAVKFSRMQVETKEMREREQVNLTEGG